MPDRTRSKMESAFGADFSSVRIHEGPAARRLNEQLSARAFTVGSDVFFRRPMPSPDTSDGARLLAHELTHAMQQRAAPVARSVERNGRATVIRRALQPGTLNVVGEFHETVATDAWPRGGTSHRRASSVGTGGKARSKGTVGDGGTLPS